MSNGTLYQKYYMVARKSIILGIHLWWTTSWQEYDMDGVNYNEEEHSKLSEAIAQMELEKCIRDREAQPKTYTRDIEL